MEQLKERAIIGPSISIKGTLAGEEDLIIQGQVEGKIDLKRNNVTVGKNGRIKADIYGKVISIEGEVEGNLFGEEKIVLRQSGVVGGNMTAPRVNLEDGARFKGSIDMDTREESRQPSLKESHNQAGSGPETSNSEKESSNGKDQAESGQKGLGVKSGAPSSRA
ncbi:MAG: polymer-forming cytoskeletal protein [Syntrophobacteria bacterium]